MKWFYCTPSMCVYCNAVENITTRLEIESTSTMLNLNNTKSLLVGSSRNAVRFEHAIYRLSGVINQPGIWRTHYRLW